MAPGFRDLLKELRVFGEAAAFAANALFDVAPSDRDASSKGVLLIPGLMAGDASLYPLAGRLKIAGYRVFFPGIWCNADCPARTMERLEGKLREAHASTGAKVTIIGHSLGGVYARELARRLPDLVERAILLGAPLKHPLESASPPIRAMIAVMEAVHRNCLASLGEPCPVCGIDLPATPPQVPETIIFTRSDGIVDWRSCLEAGPGVEAVEVTSSHCGLGMSLEAWSVIKDRLATTPATPEPARRRPSADRPTFSRLRPPYLRLVKRTSSAA